MKLLFLKLQSKSTELLDLVGLLLGNHRSKIIPLELAFLLGFSQFIEDDFVIFLLLGHWLLLHEISLTRRKSVNDLFFRLLALDEIKREQEKRGREIQRLMLQAQIQARGMSDVGQALEVLSSSGEGNVIQIPHHRHHPCQKNTIFGEINIDRLGYGSRGVASIHPIDEDLALPERSFSYGLQRRLVKAAVQGSFDEALERAEESTGVRVPKAAPGVPAVVGPESSEEHLAVA
ncbi:MAG: hypothetical protein HY717_01860 [Planctomycetes bacterium]|nr:hypothetical protein [Planctomycetota bacterium]